MHKTVGALRRLEGRQSLAVRPLNPKADD
jgi:hypothetical protein